MITTGKVISVALDVDMPKQDKSGTYLAYMLTYVDQASGQKRDLIKPMQGLKYKPTIKNTLSELKPGDTFQMHTDKNEKGFVDVLALAKGELSPEVVAAGSVGNATSVSGNASVSKNSGGMASGGKVLGSNYETPEERKVKQRLIVRQAALNQAIALNPKGKFEDIAALAKQFEGHVYEGIE